jgi:hypothetical protein
MVRNTVRLDAALKISVSGSLAAGRSSPGGAARRERSMISSSSVLPPRERAPLVARVELGGELEFEQRLLVPFRGREAPGAEGVLLRRAELGAIERQPRVVVVGVRLEGVRVFDDGAVVILHLLRALAGLDRRRRGAPAGQERHQAHAGRRDSRRRRPFSVCPHR